MILKNTSSQNAAADQRIFSFVEQHRPPTVSTQSSNAVNQSSANVTNNQSVDFSNNNGRGGDFDEEVNDDGAAVKGEPRMASDSNVNTATTANMAANDPSLASSTKNADNNNMITTPETVWSHTNFQRIRTINGLKTKWRERRYCIPQSKQPWRKYDIQNSF